MSGGDAGSAGGGGRRPYRGGRGEAGVRAARYEVASLEPRELQPGHHGRFIHSEHTTHVYWEIEAGAKLPEHSHPHEQIVNMLEGRYELVVDGESHVLEEGDVLVIPGGATHGGGALTDCRILDVFSPVREEYR